MATYGQNPFAPGMTTDTFIPDGLIAGNLQLVTKGVTLSGGSYKRGMLLGTADGVKYIACVKTATDGSEKPAAVLVNDTDASSEEVKTGVYLMGEFNVNAVSFDPSWAIEDLIIACEPSNIYLRTPAIISE